MKQMIGIVASLASLAVTPAAAATPEEEVRYTVVKSVIDREVQVSADRLLADFAEAAPDSTYLDVLRLHYARVFAVTATGDEKASLEQQEQQLQQQLEGKADSLPDEMAELVRNDNPFLWVYRYVNPTLSIMNPHLPKPQVWTEEMQAELQARFDGLIEVVPRALAAADQQIEEWEPKLDEYNQNPTEGNAHLQIEAIKRRFKWTTVLWLSNMALREAHVRGQEWGLDTSKVVALNKEIYPKNFRRYDNWDWIWGNSNLDFKHRLLVLRMQGSLWGAEDAPVEDMIGYADEGLYLDTEQYRGSQRDYAQLTKAKMLYDILYWYLQLAEEAENESDAERYRAEGLRRFEERRDAVIDDLGDRDEARSTTAAETMLLVARLYARDGKVQDAISQLKAVQSVRPGSAAAGYTLNAKKWEQALLNMSGPSEADWSAPPVAVDPKAADGTAKSFIGAADQLADLDKKRALFLQAAVALRNAIYAMETPAYQDQFLTYGPQIYRRYGRVLGSDLGWPEQAATALMTGAAKVAAIWDERNDGGEWRNGDEVTELGELAKGVISDAQTRVAQLRRVNESEAARAMTEQVNAYASTADVFTDDRKLIVDYLQTERYDEAIQLGQKYLAEQDDLEKQLWTSKVIAAAGYKKFAALARADDPQAKQAFDELEAHLADLKKRYVPELEKENPLPEAVKAKDQWLTLELARLVRGEAYVDALKLLGPTFWEEPPGDPALLQRSAIQLAIAAFSHMVGIAKDPEKVADPQLLFDTIPLYDNAYTAVTTTLELVPKAKLSGASQRVAACYRTASQQLAQFIDAKEQGAEKFLELDLEAMKELRARCVLSYAELIEPTYGPNTEPDKFLALGNDLLAIGEYRRAAQNFETYLQTLRQDPDLKAFREDPRAAIDPVGTALVNARRAYRDPWAKIRDLLIDDPSFVAQYHLQNEENWREEPRDFFKAWRLLKDLVTDLEDNRVMLGTAADEVIPKVKSLQDTVGKLARSIKVTTDLVTCYSALGEYDRMAERANQLYQYDKQRVEYRLWFVSSVIQAAKAGKADQEDMKEARSVAAGLRADTRPFPDKQDLYWESVVQVLELSQMMEGEVDVVQRMLKRHSIDNVNPAEDLYVGGTDPRRPRSDKALEIARRYLELFDAEGINLPKPYRIGTHEGEKVFLPADEENE